jgi:cytochrome c-type biogenesis protein CcsB
MKPFLKYLPWFFVALFGAEIIAVLAPKKEGEFHLQAFGRLPVLLGGRVQPFDSVARNSLLQIRSTGDVPLEEVPSWKFWHHPKKLKSTEWLLELMTRPEVADTRPVFLIHHSELLSDLKLQDKGVEHSGLRYYTFDQLKPVLKEIGEQGKEAEAVKEEEKRTAFQKQALKLANAVMLYGRLKYTLQPEGVDNWSSVLADFQKNIGPAREAARASQQGQDYDKEILRKLAEPLEQFQMMSAYGYPMTVPPEAPEISRDAWKTTGASLMDSAREDHFSEPAQYYARIATAYRQKDATAFNQSIDEYTSWLQGKFSKEAKKGRAEFYYNQIKGFLHATIMYICAFILAAIGLLTLQSAPSLAETLRKSSFYLILLAAVIHTGTLIFRMALEGRPPVTNLYSSAIFIGWGAVMFGIALELIYRSVLGCCMAALAGFITLLIAHNLALGGDTMEMLRAVLDTNFWLSTHVVTVTLGYASTFAAGLLALLYILIGIFTPLLKQKVGVPIEAAKENKSPRGKKVTPEPSGLELGKALAKMVYAIVCFATLFSFVGTVLGGIWADQSWGRFWGWDPKENGALLIVIWNAIILHARWGGLVRERGIMNLAVFGNIVTSFSWFGVNMLGIGLHSYGFMDAAFWWLLLFVGTQAAIILLGLLPLKYWRSFGIASGGNPKPPLPGFRAGTQPVPG